MFLLKQHIKLSPLSVTPSVDDLKGLFTEVQKIHGCSVELPWAIDTTRFVLDVRINIGEEEALWTLSEGDGVESHTVWSAPFNDVYLLREVVSLSVAEIVLEHKQAQLTAEAPPVVPPVESGNLSSENINYSFSKPGMADNLGVPDGLQREDEFAIHSYRNKENSFASCADIVNQRKSRAEQSAKTEELAKKPEELIDKAEECINKAEETINKADQSIDKADQSIDKAEKSINMAGQLIDGLNESAGLMAAAAQSTANMGISGNESTQASPPAPNQGINQPSLAQGISAPPTAAYAYFYQHSVPIPYPVTGPAQPLSTMTPEFIQPTNPNASITRLGVTDARLVRKQTKFLMGQFLVDSGLLPEKTLEAALKLQAMVGGNVISRAQAVETINRVHYRGGNLDIVQLMRDSTTNGNNAAAQEQSYPLLGGVLVEAKVIDDSTLEAVLKMQEIVRAGAMSKEQACQILNKELVLSGLSKRRIEQTEKTREQQTLDLLIKAGLINKEDKTTVYNVQKKHGGKIEQILIAAGKLSEETYEAAFECEYLIHEGKIKLEEAIIALNYCERSRVNLAEAIEELGFQFDR